MNDDQRAFEQFAEANGVHYAKQAAQLADYDTGDDMHVMLKTVLDALPQLKPDKLAKIKPIGNPTDHGTDRAGLPPAKRTIQHASDLDAEARAVKDAGTIAARVKYAQEKRKAGG